MPVSPEDVALLLRRTGFGGRSAEISALAKLELPALVDRILDATPPGVAAPPLVTDPKAERYRAWVSFTQWWVDRMATTPAPLVEKMILFWHGHFTSSLEKVGMVPMWKQFQLFRSKGMGNFLDLAQAVAIDPAMLDYLDNRRNRKGKVNENFAREMMELFFLGVNQYTQEDVVAAARAWTGHGTSDDDLNYVFDPAQHDNEMKTFFGKTKNWNGPEIIHEICTGAKRPVLARHIVRELWTFFAHASPSQGLVDELAGVFIRNNLEIRPLLRAMFLRPEFYATASEQNHVLSPIEYVVAVTKYSGVPASESNPEWYFEGMGQQPMYPPNVSGWNGYKSWVTTSAMWSKGNYARRIGWVSRKRGLLDPIKAMTVSDAVNTALVTFNIERATPTTKAAMTSLINSERAARSGQEAVSLTVLALMTPEFQLG